MVRMRTRRSFLTVFSTAGLALFAAQYLPALTPARVRRKHAIQFLTDALGVYMHGRDSRSLPESMVASAELFDAYESELMRIMRRGNGVEVLFGSVDPPSLKFRALDLRRGPSCSYWAVDFEPARRLHTIS